MINKTVPDVSIVIPMFNAAKYIDEAIESCLRQTFEDYEIIVVDDASTDNSLEKVKQFNEVKILQNTDNRGNSYCRNRGWKSARGKLVKFLDADDIFDKNCLNEQVAEYHRSLKRAVVYSPYMAIDKHGALKNNILREPSFCGHKDQLLALLVRNLQTGSCLYPLEILQEFDGFDERKRYGADYDLNVRIAAAGIPFVKASGISCYYRKHEDSFSANRWKSRDLSAELRDWDLRVEDITRLRNDPLEPQHIMFFSKVYWNLARDFLRVGNKKMGLSTLSKSISYSTGINRVLSRIYFYFCKTFV